MSDLLWPLGRNRIRRDMRNHTFGWVRTEIDKVTSLPKPRAHQGWDLVAGSHTACYAVADGKIALMRLGGDYGKQIALAFQHRGRTLYAFYAHLSTSAVFEGASVKAGDLIAYCGNTGNASNMKGDDQHLHFEIRTALIPGGSLNNRLDPKEVYGPAPMGYFIEERHALKQRESVGTSQDASLGLRIQTAQIRRWPSSE